MPCLDDFGVNVVFHYYLGHIYMNRFEYGRDFSDFVSGLVLLCESVVFRFFGRTFPKIVLKTLFQYYVFFLSV